MLYIDGSCLLYFNGNWDKVYLDFHTTFLEDPDQALWTFSTCIPWIKWQGKAFVSILEHIPIFKCCSSCLVVPMACVWRSFIASQCGDRLRWYHTFWLNIPRMKCFYQHSSEGIRAILRGCFWHLKRCAIYLLTAQIRLNLSRPLCSQTFWLSIPRMKCFYQNSSEGFLAILWGCTWHHKRCAIYLLTTQIRLNTTTCQPEQTFEGWVKASAYSSSRHVHHWTPTLTIAQ